MAHASRTIMAVRPDGQWVRDQDVPEVGEYYALVIGIDAYAEFDPLRCAVNDARAVAKALRERYGFKDVALLVNEDATDDAIKDALSVLRKKVTPRDSVLIYYAGHGTLEGDLGYWVPVNGQRTSDAQYLEHAAIRSRLRPAWLPARHVLLVCDSCYAGALFRKAVSPQEPTPKYVQDALRTPSRQCLTSGGLYPVPDSDAAEHSVFARYFLKALENPPREVFVPSDIFPTLRYNVSQNAPEVEPGQPQTPILGELTECGHEKGGEFVFFRRLAEDEDPGVLVPDMTAWEREQEDLRRREGRRRLLSAARTAYGICQEADAAESYTPEEKARKWERYLRDFEASGHNLDHARERETHWRTWKPKPTVVVPRGWTAEKKRVTVATPEGDQQKDIPYFSNTLGMKFVRIPAGEFMMGDTLSPEEVDKKWPGGQLGWYKASHPRHRVKLTQPFYLGAHAVTRGQFAQFVRETGYKTDGEREGKSRVFKDGKWDWQEGADWRNPLFEQTDEHPVVCVSWNDAKAFCQWLGKKEGVACRLPTQGEWEYAARAGSGTTWYWGDEEGGAQGRANVADEEYWDPAFKGVRDGYQYTAPVGTFAPNAFGLYDVIGNVWEWCEDWYRADHYGQSPAEDPKGPTEGQYRVLRGGSWISYPRFARAAYRCWDTPGYRRTSLGFRMVCVVR